MQNISGVNFPGRKFVEYKIATSKSEAITAIKFEYLLAAGGLFIRAKRREFSVCLPLSSRVRVKGLPEVASGITWHKPKIPALVWQQILENARRANDFTEFKEDVFVIFWVEAEGVWKWRKISKERKWAATIADDTLEEYAEACIELHTHPEGAYHFSPSDDRDETGKFRIFGILIDIHSNTPKIRFHCGVYEYFVLIPAPYVSEMPAEIVDLNAPLKAVRNNQND